MNKTLKAKLQVLRAAQITDDITGAIPCQLCGGYGGPVFVAFEDGRWACLDRRLHLFANLPDAIELYRVGLLARDEYIEVEIEAMKQ